MANTSMDYVFHECFIMFIQTQATQLRPQGRQGLPLKKMSRWMSLANIISKHSPFPKWFVEAKPSKNRVARPSLWLLTKHRIQKVASTSLQQKCQVHDFGKQLAFKKWSNKNPIQTCQTSTSNTIVFFLRRVTVLSRCSSFSPGPFRGHRFAKGRRYGGDGGASMRSMSHVSIMQAMWWTTWLFFCGSNVRSVCETQRSFKRNFALSWSKRDDSNFCHSISHKNPRGCPSSCFPKHGQSLSIPLRFMYGIFTYACIYIMQLNQMPWNNLYVACIYDICFLYVHIFNWNLFLPLP